MMLVIHPRPPLPPRPLSTPLLLLIVVVPPPPLRPLCTPLLLLIVVVLANFVDLDLSVSGKCLREVFPPLYGDTSRKRFRNFPKRVPGIVSGTFRRGFPETIPELSEEGSRNRFRHFTDTAR